MADKITSFRPNVKVSGGVKVRDAEPASAEAQEKVARQAERPDAFDESAKAKKKPLKIHVTLEIEDADDIRMAIANVVGGALNASRKEVQGLASEGLAAAGAMGAAVAGKAKNLVIDVVTAPVRVPLNFATSLAHAAARVLQGSKT